MREIIMQQKLSTKALPQYDWGQEWIKPNGELSCIVVLCEDLYDSNLLRESFHDKTIVDDTILFSDITGTMSEKTFYKRYPTVVKNLINDNPNDLVVLATFHAFTLDLIKGANFRPDMFYIYDSKRGYRRLPDTTPRELRFGQNYSRMYIAGAFDGGIGSFEKAK